MFGTIPILVAWLLLVTTSSIVVSSASANDPSPTDSTTISRRSYPEAYHQRLVDWLLEDPNGFFHPGIQWKRGSGSSNYALYATEDIPKGTPLVVVPRKYVLESDLDPTPPFDIDDFDDPRMCVTTLRVLSEYNHLKESSFYAPELSYLFETSTKGGARRGILPAAWSNYGQQILEWIVLGDEDEKGDWNDSLPDAGFGGIRIENRCIAGQFSHAFTPKERDARDRILSRENKSLPDVAISMEQAEDAFMFLLQYGWYDKIVPILNMFNHGNGPSRNVEMTPVNEKNDSADDDDIAAYAWRDIAAGEPLIYTYSECMDISCHFGGSRYDYPTQVIFNDYGFVEPYPRRWALSEELIAEIDLDPKDASKRIFRWIYFAPDERDLEWLERHLDRLESIELSVRNAVEEMKFLLLQEGKGSTIHAVDHERNTILDLYEGYVEVLELALQHGSDPVAWTQDDEDRRVEELQRKYAQVTIRELRQHELLVGKSSSRLSRQWEAVEVELPDTNHEETFDCPLKSAILNAAREIQNKV